MRSLLPLLLTGCLVDRAAYQERQTEICHPVSGCTDRPWWPDADGDGWGDPTAEPMMAPREPDSGFVNNLLDCDDTDPDLTAALGELCPDGFGSVAAVRAGTAEADLGDGFEPVEWLVVELSPDGGLLLHEAVDRCELGWGGVLGAPRDAVAGFEGVWVRGTTGTLHPTWGEVLFEGPAVWSGEELEAAVAETEASVACMRPVPDPSEWETFEVPQ